MTEDTYTCFVCEQEALLSEGRYRFSEHDICLTCYSRAAAVGLAHVIEVLERRDAARKESKGLCAHCGKPVNHAFPWFTKNPHKGG